MWDMSKELFNSWSGYIDLTISKAVHLTHFVDPMFAAPRRI